MAGSRPGPARRRRSTGEATDPRRIAAAEFNEQLPPEAKALHLYDLDATMEDTELLGMAFHGQGYTLPVYSYHAWWRHADLTPTYHYHRRVVKLLASQRPPNLWLFKAPHHMFHLEAIVAAYPDVRFVMTHRDPAKVVPSYVSTVNMFFPPPDGQRDMHRLGSEVCEHLRDGMRNTIAARERLGDDRFIDVHHRDLVADPVGTLRRVYDFVGLQWPDMESALADWRQRQPTRRARGAPLHRGAVRAGPRADPRRLRLLHRALRCHRRMLNRPNAGISAPNVNTVRDSRPNLAVGARSTTNKKGSSR